jgi:hypothetical protein
VAAALLALTAGGCRVAVDVGLDVAGDGSGEVQVAVTLDAEAAGRVDLADQLRVDDLRRAGWTVAGPQRSDDGSTVVTATKAFTTPETADEVLEEVSGPGGPLRDFEVARRSTFSSTTYAFDGVVDLSAGIEGFSDDELRAALAGSGFSLAGAELEEAIGGDVADTFRFEVHTELPGTVDARPPGTVNAGGARWRPVVGDQVALSATSRLWHTERLLWLALTAASALATVVVLVRNRRRGKREAE